MVKTRSRSHKRVFTWFASRRPQTPAEASLEASLKIQRPQGAGRPCYEAERTPLAVENGVGKLAANARQMPAWERELANSHPPICPCLTARLGRDLLFLGMRIYDFEGWDAPPQLPNFPNRPRSHDGFRTQSILSPSIFQADHPFAFGIPAPGSAFC